MKKIGLDIAIDTNARIIALKQKEGVLRQACSMHGGTQKYFSELYKYLQQDIHELSEEIYNNLIGKRANAKKVKEDILAGGQIFLPFYSQLMRGYSFGAIFPDYDKAHDDIQSYQSKLEQFLIQESDKFSKKYNENSRPFWKKRGFWKNLGGILVGLATLLSAIPEISKLVDSLQLP